ncbi:MAG: beta-ketoacyl-[acyl-carrier-protein] synthase family protein [Phycisphaerales bacterium]|nr:beta-ketoacyl-[acyl-carrier-protein] synthase family protein [Phycisphaerales bacterium]
MTRGVVITGMGWITPLGNEVGAVWSRLLRGESGIGRVSLYDASTFTTNFAAEVREFRLEDWLPDTAPHRHAARSTRFALAAAAQAWRQAGLDRARVPARRVGAYLGSGEGSLDFDNFVECSTGAWRPAGRTVDTGAWAAAATARLSAHTEIGQEPNLCLSHLAREFGFRGPSSNCMTACAASTQAIGEAFEVIRHGDADVMLAGGSHSMIHPLGMSGFIRLTAMSARRDDPAGAARPFDRTRDGFVMGEGAGVLVLESLDHARARGAAPLAELAGYGSSADAFRITDIEPEGRGAVAAMSRALRQAGISPREPEGDGRPPVHYISAHGTGTQENDAIESLAVKQVFGPLAGRVPFSSVKSMLGHLIQAAGAVELITCVEAIRTGWLPPTMNLHHPDPKCDLDYIPNAARDERARGVRVCLSNSFGFGGQNNTVCVRRFEE